MRVLASCLVLLVLSASLNPSSAVVLASSIYHLNADTPTPKEVCPAIGRVPALDSLDINSSQPITFPNTEEGQGQFTLHTALCRMLSFRNDNGGAALCGSGYAALYAGDLCSVVFDVVLSNMSAVVGSGGGNEEETVGGDDANINGQPVLHIAYGSSRSSGGGGGDYEDRLSLYLVCDESLSRQGGKEGQDFLVGINGTRTDGEVPGFARNYKFFAHSKAACIVPAGSGKKHHGIGPVVILAIVLVSILVLAIVAAILRAKCVADEAQKAEGDYLGVPNTA